MTDRAVITFAAAIFESNDLLVLPLFHHFSGDFGSGNKRRSVGNLVPIGVHKDFKCHLFTCIEIEKVDIDRVAFSDAVLTTTSFDNSVGHKKEVLLGEKPRTLPWEQGFDKRKPERPDETGRDKLVPSGIPRAFSGSREGRACLVRLAIYPPPEMSRTISPFGGFAE